VKYQWQTVKTPKYQGLNWGKHAKRMEPTSDHKETEVDDNNGEA
jgi:hypothetical protein